MGIFCDNFRKIDHFKLSKVVKYARTLGINVKLNNHDVTKDKNNHELSLLM